MTKRTLSKKNKYAILRLLGFRTKMSTTQGRKIIRNRRKKGRKSLTSKS